MHLAAENYQINHNGGTAEALNNSYIPDIPHGPDNPASSNNTFEALVTAFRLGE